MGSCKKKHIESVADKAARNVATKQARSLAKEIDACERISDVILKTLSDAEQFNRYIVQNDYQTETGDTVRVTEEQMFKKIDTRSLKEAAQALKLVEEMKRSLLNIQTMQQKNRELREARKLKIEEERLELQKAQVESKQSTDSTLEVVIKGFEDSWVE